MRWYNAAAPASDKLIPDAASSSRVSRSVNRRSPARISATSSASLSWCSLIGGSRRDDNTTRAELGRIASKCSSCVRASADLSSWRSSMISTTGSTCSATSDRTLSITWSHVERSGRAQVASQDQSSAPGCGSRLGRRTRTAAAFCWSRVDGHERNLTKVGRAVSPCTQQRGLPTSRRRRNDSHPFGHERDRAAGGDLSGRAGPGRPKRPLRSAAARAPALPRHQAGHLGATVECSDHVRWLDGRSDLCSNLAVGSSSTRASIAELPGR